MSTVETRQQGSRSSVFLTGEARFGEVVDPVKIRNLSESGAMLETQGKIPSAAGTKGALLRKDNEIDFTIRWVVGERYGVEFDEPIDEQELLIQIGKAERKEGETPRFRRPGLREKAQW